MFGQFLTRNDFFEKYMDLFSVRFTYGSLTVEDEKSDYISSRNSLKIYNNMEAFKSILKKDIKKLSPYDLVDVAEQVNKNINFFEYGFRRININVQGAPFFPVESKDVLPAMYSLFNNYYNVWDILPVYEREAKFHIALLRIHPFEDGNGRTSRIIMNYNLWKNGKAPIIIRKEDREKYFDFINNNRVKELAKFIEEQSNMELDFMLTLYQQICGDDNFENDVDKELKKTK